MMVAFQRKIIYLPGVPFGARSESLREGERSTALDGQLAGMRWSEISIPSSAPSRWTRQAIHLKGVEVERQRNVKLQSTKAQAHIVIVYLQGNAGTPLLRLPLFRKLLSGLDGQTRITLVAVAPRSFWLSTRSTPTEKTVLADYASVISDACQRYPDANVVLYGHSLGGAATILLLSGDGGLDRVMQARINGAILENPLPSIPFMVRALYPQRWLPYHYLGPLVFDRWDAVGLMKRGATQLQIPSLWIRSACDEIIPTGTQDGVREMFEAQASSKSDTLGATRWVTIDQALHDTAFEKKRWKDCMEQFLTEIVEAESTKRTLKPSRSDPNDDAMQMRIK